MVIKHHSEQNVFLLEGRLNRQTYTKLHKSCRTVESDTIIFDFSKIIEIDSTGIGSLLSCPHCNKKRIILINVEGQPLSILKHLKLEKRFNLEVKIETNSRSY